MMMTKKIKINAKNKTLEQKRLEKLEDKRLDAILFFVGRTSEIRHDPIDYLTKEQYARFIKIKENKLGNMR